MYLIDHGVAYSPSERRPAILAGRDRPDRRLRAASGGSAGSVGGVRGPLPGASAAVSPGRRPMARGRAQGARAARLRCGASGGTRVSDPASSRCPPLATGRARACFGRRHAGWAAAALRLFPSAYECVARLRLATRRAGRGRAHIPSGGGIEAAPPLRLSVPGRRGAGSSRTRDAGAGALWPRRAHRPSWSSRATRPGCRRSVCGRFPP